MLKNSGKNTKKEYFPNEILVKKIEYELSINGIKLFKRFSKNLETINFKFIYVFRDGSWLKSRKKLFKRKVKKFGRPILVVSSDIFDSISEELKFSKEEKFRRASMAEDMHNDVIWIQKMLIQSEMKILNQI